MRALLLLAATAAGCGYGFTGAAPTVPKAAHTVAITRFTNHTREKGLDVTLQQAIEDEFRRRGPLSVVRDPEGDVVVSGSIRRFTSIPVAFGATDNATQYIGWITVHVRLRDRRTGKVLYENAALEESLDFGATSSVVVSSSPLFQQGTINARDLVDMTNVQLGETRRREALSTLVDRVAGDVYLQTMEGF
jgi:hypothetical protein